MLMLAEAVFDREAPIFCPQPGLLVLFSCSFQCRSRTPPRTGSTWPNSSADSESFHSSLKCGIGAGRMSRCSTSFLGGASGFAISTSRFSGRR